VSILSKRVGPIIVSSEFLEGRIAAPLYFFRILNVVTIATGSLSPYKAIIFDRESQFLPTPPAFDNRYLMLVSNAGGVGKIAILDQKYLSIWLYGIDH